MRNMRVRMSRSTHLHRNPLCGERIAHSPCAACHLHSPVDLYVLERAFLSTHPNTEKMVRLTASDGASLHFCSDAARLLTRSLPSSSPSSAQFSAVLNTYRDTYGLASKVMAWLLKVRQRGRKREMVG